MFTHSLKHIHTSAPPVVFDDGTDSDKDRFATRQSQVKPVAGNYAKQLYWPVDDGYHVVVPLWPTVNTHSIWRAVTDALWGQKEVRDARKANAPSDEVFVSYPNLGVIKIGGAKPLNASYLAAKQLGNYYLFPALPRPQSEPKNFVKALAIRQLERVSAVIPDRHRALTVVHDGVEITLSFEFIRSENFLQHPAWLALRERVLANKPRVCHWCDGHIDGVVNCDHVLPRATFPLLALDYNNILPTHAQCNKEKGNRYTWETDVEGGDDADLS